jgi:hypothetical protein
MRRWVEPRPTAQVSSGERWRLPGRTIHVHVQDGPGNYSDTIALYDAG